MENCSLLERKGKKPPHSLCFSLFLHIVMVPNKSDYIHSLGMLTSGFQDPPVWQLVDDDRQTITRLQTTQRNVHNQEMSYTVFPQCTSVHLRVCLWTTYKTLLLLLDICYSVHVTAPAKTLIVLKGHDRVCNVCLHMYSIWRDVLNLRSGFFFPVCCAFYLKRVGDTSAVEKSAFSWI